MGRPFWIIAVLAWACCIVAAPAGAQFIIDHESSGKRLRGLHGPASPAIKRSFESDREAATTFREILSATGIPGVADRIQVRASAETANAEAQIGEDGQRYIFYNSTFMRELGARTSKYWSLVFVIAHEVGHHIAGHLDFAGQNHRVELEADRYAGFILGRMGATHEEAIAAVDGIGSPAASATHPPRDQRVQIVSLGWNDGAGGGQSRRPADRPIATPTPPPAAVAPPGRPSRVNYAYHVGTRLEGSTITIAPQANVEACRQSCDTTTGCIGYQFGGPPPLSRSCQLFDAVTGRAFDQNWRSGLHENLAKTVSVLPAGPATAPDTALKTGPLSITKSTPLSILRQPSEPAPPPPAAAPKSVDAPLRFGYKTRTHVSVAGELIKENQVDSPLACLLVCMNTSLCTAATFVTPASGQGPCKIYGDPVQIKSDQPGNVTLIHK
jgi:hypothetical protein